MIKQTGFTLIELIATLVIMALLGAMAVPRFVDVETPTLESSQKAAPSTRAVVQD